MPALTHGPLPARVYWFRRLLILGTAVLLVVAIARLLGDSSDASSNGGGAARLAADGASSSAPAATDAVTPTATDTSVTPSAVTTTSAAPVLATPDGYCRSSDIAVTPTVSQGVAGRDVMIVLEVRTMTAEACTWRVSPTSLTVSVTSGKDPIWNTRACPQAIARQDVVVRKAVTATIGVVWKDAKRSTQNCSPRTGWALPGWYHVTAAALGGEPSDQQFALRRPAAATITVTASPTQSPSQSQSPSQGPDAKASKPGKHAGATPTGSPSSGKVD